MRQSTIIQHGNLAHRVSFIITIKHRFEARKHKNGMKIEKKKLKYSGFPVILTPNYVNFGPSLQTNNNIDIITKVSES